MTGLVPDEGRSATMHSRITAAALRGTETGLVELGDELHDDGRRLRDVTPALLSQVRPARDNSFGLPSPAPAVDELLDELVELHTALSEAVLDLSRRVGRVTENTMSTEHEVALILLHGQPDAARANSTTDHSASTS